MWQREKTKKLCVFMMNFIIIYKKMDDCYRRCKSIYKCQEIFLLQKKGNRSIYSKRSHWFCHCETTHYPQNSPFENSKCQQTQICNIPKMYCNYLKILKKITGNTNATDEIFILKQTICNSYYRTDLIHIIEQCVIRTNIH